MVQRVVSAVAGLTNAGNSRFHLTVECGAGTIHKAIRIRDLSMPAEEKLPGNDPTPEDVLKLSEVAAYLRLPEDAVLRLAKDGAIPANRVGDEWRFLRKAVQFWLVSGDRRFHREWPFHPLFWMESPLGKDLVHFIKKRIIDELEFARLQKMESGPKAGSKDAVLGIIGIFKDDDDLEERLADARKRRGSG